MKIICNLVSTNAYFKQKSKATPFHDNNCTTHGLSLAISSAEIDSESVIKTAMYVATSDIVKNLMHQVITCSTCLLATYTLLVAMY